MSYIYWPQTTQRFLLEKVKQGYFRAFYTHMYDEFPLLDFF